jgi:hypothetical protein
LVVPILATIDGSVGIDGVVVVGVFVGFVVGHIVVVADGDVVAVVVDGIGVGIVPVRTFARHHLAHRCLDFVHIGFLHRHRPFGTMT